MTTLRLIEGGGRTPPRAAPDNLTRAEVLLDLAETAVMREQLGRPPDARDDLERVRISICAVIFRLRVITRGEA